MKMSDLSPTQAMNLARDIGVFNGTNYVAEKGKIGGRAARQALYIYLLIDPFHLGVHFPSRDRVTWSRAVNLSNILFDPLPARQSANTRSAHV